MNKINEELTLEEAHKCGICIECKQPALSRCYSTEGRKEYGITALCELCFDQLFEYE